MKVVSQAVYFSVGEGAAAATAAAAAAAARECPS